MHYLKRVSVTCATLLAAGSGVSESEADKVSESEADKVSES